MAGGGFTVKPLHIPFKGIIVFFFLLLCTVLPKGLPSGVPIRLYQSGWNCAGLMEAENEIIHFHFALFLVTKTVLALQLIAAVTTSNLYFNLALCRCTKDASPAKEEQGNIYYKKKKKRKSSTLFLLQIY